MKVPTVFVYGTLRRGFNNHGRYLTEAKFLGNAVAEGTLYENHSRTFPYAKFVAGGEIIGEVYEVNPGILNQLDRLEGFRKDGDQSNHYNRIRIPVKMEDGTVKHVFTYEGNIDPSGYNPIPGGDFVRHMQK